MPHVLNSDNRSTGCMPVCGNAGAKGLKLVIQIISAGRVADAVSMPEFVCEDPTARTRLPQLLPVLLIGTALAQPTPACFCRYRLAHWSRPFRCCVPRVVEYWRLILMRKLDLARRFGAEVCNPGVGEDPVAAGMTFSRGHGVDGVIVTASTKSSDPIVQAARMCRKRARIVLVGVTGLELNRADFYEKELTFQVSCSYGPGRYDPTYEEGGHDYPLGFVRWTEQRNFEAVLEMLASDALDKN